MRFFIFYFFFYIKVPFLAVPLDNIKSKPEIANSRSKCNYILIKKKKNPMCNFKKTDKTFVCSIKGITR